MTWNPKILETWQDKDNDAFADPPPSFSENLVAETQTIRSLLTAHNDGADDRGKRELILAIQDVLLSGVGDKHWIGRVLSLPPLFRRSADSHSHISPISIVNTMIKLSKNLGMTTKRRFGWHICKCPLKTRHCPLTCYRTTNAIDGRKSGKHIREEIKTKDCARWRKPEVHPTIRPESFVLDQVAKDAEKKWEELKINYQKPFDSFSIDEDLCKPWRDEVERVKGLCRAKPKTGEALRAELDLIQRFVEKAYKESRACTPRFRDSIVIKRQKLLREESLAFANGPLDVDLYQGETLQRLKASYLYIFDIQQREKISPRWSRKPWNLAMGTLCSIKAGSSRYGQMVFTHEFGLRMQMTGISRCFP
jgi:hypothetical protein